MKKAEQVEPINTLLLEQEIVKWKNQPSEMTQHCLKVIPWLSGTKRKRTIMYKETSIYEKDAKIDYELGVISKEEYEIEMKSVQLLEQALANYSVY